MSDNRDDDMKRADTANGEGDPNDTTKPTPDPDAPGAGVDDDEAGDVPEPNEPA
jgi:hypothetical protein